MTITRQPVSQNDRSGHRPHDNQQDPNRWQHYGPRYDQRAHSGWPQRGATGGNTEQLTRALGWFSIGLGLAQIMMPRSVARLIGVNDDQATESVLRAVGVREIASGIGILTQPNPAGWVKARVGGDVMDLALLGAELNADDAQRDRVTKTMVAVAGVTALDVYCSQQLSGQPSGNQQWTGPRTDNRRLSDQQLPARDNQSRDGQRKPAVRQQQGIHVVKAITINRSPEEIYQFWHNFENLPRFMSHLASVQVMDGQRSHWKAKAPAGMTVEWDAEIIDDTPNERISWRSLEGSDVPNAGSVRFKPAAGGRGTVVTVEIQYEPPGGKLGTAIAKLFGEEPEGQVQDDLRAFKQVMEIGEVVRSDATPWGPRIAQRPAQPLSEKEMAQH